MQSKIAHTNYFILLSAGTHSGYRLWKMWPTSVVSRRLSPEEDWRNECTHLPTRELWLRVPRAKLPWLSSRLRSELRGVSCCLLNYRPTYIYCEYQNSNKLYITLFKHNAFKKANVACMAPLKNGNTSNLVSKRHPQLLKTKALKCLLLVLFSSSVSCFEFNNTPCRKT